MKTLDRRNTNCVKWDCCPDPDMLPLWVADMDFETAPAIVEAINKRAAHGIYGYARVPESYFKAVTSWFSRKHGWEMDPADIIYTIGVVPAISAILDAMARPGDDVVTFTPAYNCFFSCIRNRGCRLSASELVYSAQDNKFHIDFEDLERRLAQPKATIMLLCNPHNPTGRVWTREELMRIGELCLRHNVFIISDEIHCEFTLPGHEYTPFASLSEELALHCAACTSPSKAFNIAGLQAANITVKNPEAHRLIDRAINDAEICDLGVFGPVAVEAAYNGGEQWLKDLNATIADNYAFLRDYIAANIPIIKTTTMEGTYLPWLDCSALIGSGKAFESSQQLCEHLKKYKVWLNPGDMYDCCSSVYVRVNIACSKETLALALERLSKCINEL